MTLDRHIAAATPMIPAHMVFVATEAIPHVLVQETTCREEIEFRHFSERSRRRPRLITGGMRPVAGFSARSSRWSSRLHHGWLFSVIRCVSILCINCRH